MFRTVEISDPRFEVEGLRFVTVQSPAIGGRADLALFVPPQVRGLEDVPVVILLHGVYGSHWAWAFNGGAHRTAARMIEAKELPPVVLVMPSDGLWRDGSGYVPHILPEDPRRHPGMVMNDAKAPAEGTAATAFGTAAPDFERWIVDEVPVAASVAVPEVSTRSPLCLAGLSMGGFGALRLGGKHPHRFRAVSGHSSATDKEQFRELLGARLDAWSDAEEDRSVLAAMLRNRHQLPPIRFDCGTEDFLVEENRELHQALDAAGIAHVYEEFTGGHTWPYWEEHLADSFRFFAQALR